MIGNVPSIAPVGLPKGVDPRTWRQAIEKRLNELLDQSLALITALDMMEVDPDFEPNGDDEEWLGWTERGTGAGGVNTDRELDEADDEPWLASPNGNEHRSQVGWCAGAYDDGEVDDGDDEENGDMEPGESGVADLDALALTGLLPAH